MPSEKKYFWLIISNLIGKLEHVEKLREMCKPIVDVNYHAMLLKCPKDKADDVVDIVAKMYKDLGALLNVFFIDSSISLNGVFKMYLLILQRSLYDDILEEIRETIKSLKELKKRKLPI